MKRVEIFAVAGELEPDCGVTNRVLMAICPKEKKTIIITEMPYGL